MMKYCAEAMMPIYADCSGQDTVYEQAAPLTDPECEHEKFRVTD